MKNYITPAFEVVRFVKDDICTGSNTPLADPWGFDFDWEET